MLQVQIFMCSAKDRERPTEIRVTGAALRANSRRLPPIGNAQSKFRKKQQVINPAPPTTGGATGLTATISTPAQLKIYRER